MTNDCPPHQDLNRLSVGLGTDGEVRSFATHLQQCPTCIARVRCQASGDVLVRLIEQAASETIADDLDLTDEETAALIERILPQLNRPESGGTAAGRHKTARPLPDNEKIEGERGDHQDIKDWLQPATSDPFIGSLGGFDVLGVIGSGGMGIVLSARDVKLQRDVAIKVLRPELAGRASSRERFLREGRAMAAFQHPHVVQVLQVGESECHMRDGPSLPWMVMPRLEGESLEQRLRDDAPLANLEIAKIGREVAAALKAANARSMIHRDIKPSNIWLERTPESNAESGESADVHGPWHVKVLDFGLAAEPGQPLLTAPELILGTPGYMSPEQARGEQLDARSDLFSLGCVLFECACGQAPFARSTVTATLLAVVGHAPPRPLDLNPQLDLVLSKTIERLLRKKPQQRFASAQAVLQALQECGHSTAGGKKLALGSGGVRFVVGLAVMVVVVAGVYFAAMTMRSTSSKSHSPAVEAGLPKTPAAVERNRTHSWDSPESIFISFQGGTLPGLIPGPTSLDGLPSRQLTTARPRGPMTSFAWHPSESLFAIGTEVGEVRVFDWPEKKPVSIGLAHTAAVRRICWSPDGETLASTGDDGLVQCWSGGYEPANTLSVGSAQGQALAWHPDGKWLAIGCSDGMVRIWEPSSGELRELDGHTHGVTCLAWDSTLLASGSLDGEVHVWRDLERDFVSLIPRIPAAVHCLAWHANQARLYAGYSDFSVRAWTTDGTEFPLHEGHASPVSGLSCAASGRLISSAVDSTVQLYDQSGSLEREWSVSDGKLNAVAWSPSGRWFASVGQNGTARFWSAEQGPLDVLTSGMPVIRSVHINERGLVVLGAEDGTLRRLEPHDRVEQVLAGHDRAVFAVDASFDDQLLASGSIDGSVRIWNQAGAVIAKLRGHDPVAWHATESRLAFARNQEVWSWSDGQLRRLGEVSGPITAIAWMDQDLVIGDLAGNIEVVGEDGQHSMAQCDGTIQCVAWHSEQHMLASVAFSEHAVRLWDEDHSQVGKIQLNDDQVVTCLEWLNSETLVLGLESGAVELWRSDGTLVQMLAPNIGVCLDLAVDISRQRVFVAGTHGGVCVLDVQNGAFLEMIVPVQHSGYVAVSADGTFLNPLDLSKVDRAFIGVVQTDSGQLGIASLKEFSEHRMP